MHSSYVPYTLPLDFVENLSPSYTFLYNLRNTSRKKIMESYTFLYVRDLFLYVPAGNLEDAPKAIRSYTFLFRSVYVCAGNLLKCALKLYLPILSAQSSRKKRLDHKDSPLL